MAVTKKDIITQIASDTGIKQVDVKLIVQKTLDVITAHLAKGETVGFA